MTASQHPRASFTRWPILVLLLVCATSGIAASPDSAAHPLKRSDVVFMGGSSKELYEAYGATVVDWGGHASKDDPKAAAEFRARVKLAQDMGIQYNAGVGMITEFLGMIKSCPEHERAICRDFDGKPITVPWLWDHKVDGELGKAWWFCSNSPLYQKFLRDRTALAMAGEPDGFHLDDYGGTTGSMYSGGCFCETCLPLFRDHLRAHLTPEKLRALGLESLDAFDYRAFLRARGVQDNADFLKRRHSLPLYAEFQEFHARAAGQVVRELQEHAARLRGRPLVRSVNGAPPSQQALVVRPHLDHYSCEVARGAPGREWSGETPRALTPSAAFVYRCADMLGRGIAATADGHSWAWVNERGAVNLCRHWIAESYAFGQCFMAPGRRQWCYTKEKGTHWYEAKPQDYADLYQFVRQNAALFDRADAVPQVGVLFSHAAWRRGRKDPQAAAFALLEANIPFTLLAAGDDLLPLRLDPAALAACEKIVVPAEPMLDPADRAVLDRLPPEKLLVWKDAPALVAAIAPWLSIEGARDVWALPRRDTTDPRAPLLVHLVNRRYDFATDRLTAQSRFVLHLRDALTGAHKPARCRAFTPGAEPADLPIEPEPGGLRVSLPELNLWTILRFER